MAAETTQRSGDDVTPYVAICIASYKRPQGLRRLLDGIARLTFVDARAPRLLVIVVDNDEDGTAARTCEEMTRHLPWPLQYVCEPQRGIPFARNACVRVALERGAELLVFIDDDEVPAPDWLDELLRVRRLYAASVVTGPVLPMFEGDVAEWIVKGGYFERPRHSTGTRLDRAATNNTLVEARVFQAMQPRFDERLGLTGADDTEFFLRVAREGFEIRWADSAVVQEWNPASRTNVRWLVRRSFRVGNSWGIFGRNFFPASRRAMGALARGLLSLPVAAVRGKHVWVRSIQFIALGLGFLVAKSGVRFEEYRRIHGR